MAGPTYKQTETSMPNNEGYIKAQTKLAEAYATNPQMLLAGLPKPTRANPLAEAAFALQSGMAQGAKMPTASPEANILAGLAAGLGAGPAYQAEYGTVDEVAPNLVAMMPEVSGMRFNDFIKVAGPMSALFKQQAKPITAGTKAQLKSIRPDLTEEQLSTLSEPDAVKYVIEFTKETGRGARVAQSLGNKIAFYQWLGKQPVSMTTETINDQEFLKYTQPNGSVRVVPLTKGLERGNREAIENVVSAINTLGNVDDYFASVENSGIPRLAQQAGKEGLFGDALALAYPEQAANFANATTIFQFAQGGKALTEPEKEAIQNLFSRLAYGPAEREKAKQNIKALLRNKIKATIEGNLTGKAREGLISDMNAAFGGTVTRGGDTAPPPAGQSKSAEDVAKKFNF